jgi:hypothetical protein
MFNFCKVSKSTGLISVRIQYLELGVSVIFYGKSCDSFTKPASHALTLQPVPYHSRSCIICKNISRKYSSLVHLRFLGMIFGCPRVTDLRLFFATDAKGPWEIILYPFLYLALDIGTHGVMIWIAQDPITQILSALEC